MVNDWGELSSPSKMFSSSENQRKVLILLKKNPTKTCHKVTCIASQPWFSWALPPPSPAAGAALGFAASSPWGCAAGSPAPVSAVLSFVEAGAHRCAAELC